MAVRCDILFVKNPEKIFYTGQYLEGTLRLVLVNAVNFRRINLKFFGSETIGNDEAMQKCADYAEEIIGETQVQPGTHEFPFKFWYLRSQFPSSFEGEFGNIEYFVSAVVEIPGQQKEFKEFITIINSIDINKPEFKGSLSKCSKLDFKFLFFTWSTLNIEVGISNKACTSGEDLGWNLKVKHTAPKTYRIRFELIKVITYGSGQTTEILKETTQEYEKYVRPPGGSISIPKTSGDLNGSLIKIRHFLRVTALVKNQSKHIADLPVIIVNPQHKSEN